VAKLIKILAASVGGGLVLGAGIRLGEAIATWEPAGQSGAAGKLNDRLGAIENRLQHLEADTAGARGSRLEPHPDPTTAPQAGSQIPIEPIESPGEAALRLRMELQGWMEENVATRMAEVEVRLKAESEHGRQQMLDVFVENVQTRVIHRIAQLEEEVAGQSAAMIELRECSLRTERSVQKLLGGLDKLIVKNSAAADPPLESSASPQNVGRDIQSPGAGAVIQPPEAVPPRPAETQTQPPAPSFGQPAQVSEGQRRRPSRWNIFR
jgi:uncharacterized coiled-coil protein SlyX